MVLNGLGQFELRTLEKVDWKRLDYRLGWIGLGRFGKGWIGLG